MIMTNLFASSILPSVTFLQLKRKCQDPHFFIAAGHTHAQLVLHCLKIMLKFLKRNICNVDNTVVLNSEIPDLESKLKNCVPPALLYACQYWGAHLLQSTAGDSNLHKEILNKLLEFTSIKLLCWIEVLSLEENSQHALTIWLLLCLGAR
jgi:hypothetical protein